MTGALRAEYRAKRRELPLQTRTEWNALIEAQVLSWDVFACAQTVLYYLPVGAEAGTISLAEKILAAGKTLLLPRCPARGRMEAVQVRSLSALAPDAYGIPSPPADAEPFPPERISLALVPGVAFDREGNRIGQGGGCYDRFLPQCSAKKAGIAFSVQVSQERLPTQPHDVKMDALITEKGITLF